MGTPNAGTYEPLAPLSVVEDEKTGQLLIEWTDGHTSQHSVEWLRWNCPCAGCRGEMGVPGRLSYVKELTTDETSLVDVQPIGRYAIMPFWADGHHDGILTYDMLLATCQCDACKESRSQKSPAEQKD